MHLHYLLDRGNRSVSASEGVAPARRRVEGETMLGIAMPAGRPSRLTLVGASAHPHFAGLEDLGFGVTVESPGPAPVGPECITVSWVAGTQRVSRVTSVHADAYTRLLVPNLLDLPDPFARADLVIDCPGLAQEVFIGSSGATPRQALYRLAQGTGVEIGPGPRPQIHNSETTRVTYVEEVVAEEWAALYRQDASAEAWKHPDYRIGKAHQLPVADGSLDFVFSSHVLEHLYNPLGHFDHWRQKLRPGGLVLGVVPAVEGTKDFVQPTTRLLGLVEEHRAGGFAVPLSAFETWVSAMQPGHRDPLALARKHYEQRLSIHVHVYDYVTINNLLRHCVQAHGYSDYRLFFKRNAKDFVFALKADLGASARD